jgi:hypothetical protein
MVYWFKRNASTPGSDYDYVAPGLRNVNMINAFPNMTLGDKSSVTWPHFRRDVSHRWYVDRRDPLTGFLSKDEAVLLYNIALQFQGKHALEVGCWRGWSTAHMASAGVTLDVIDPVLQNSEWKSELETTLSVAAPSCRTTLHPGTSPKSVLELGKLGKKWALAFVDGDHVAPAPLRDVQTCAPFMEPTAAIVLHDLACPDVAEALFYLRSAGWDVALFQTMQIMGVAYRGFRLAINHQADRNQEWSLPDHLHSFDVWGEAPAERAARLSEFVTRTCRLPLPRPVEDDRSRWVAIANQTRVFEANEWSRRQEINLPWPGETRGELTSELLAPNQWSKKDGIKFALHANMPGTPNSTIRWQNVALQARPELHSSYLVPSKAAPDLVLSLDVRNSQGPICSFERYLKAGTSGPLNVRIDGMPNELVEIELSLAVAAEHKTADAALVVLDPVFLRNAAA